jgi:hypothetical protein
VKEAAAGADCANTKIDETILVICTAGTFEPDVEVATGDLRGRADAFMFRFGAMVLWSDFLKVSCVY